MRTTLLEVLVGCAPALLVAACAHGSYAMLTDTPPVPRAKSCKLDIYQKADEVTRSFRRLCLVSGESGAKATMDEAMNEVREKACACTEPTS